MNTFHLTQIGELFPNEEDFDFLSDKNMLEHDFIIIDTEALVKSIVGRSVQKIQDRFNDLKEFVSKKNIPLVFLSSDRGVFAIHESRQTSIYEMLGIDAKVVGTNGRKIEIGLGTLFADFMKEFGDIFEYNVGFANHPGVSLGKAKSTNYSIGFYTKDYVFLPTFTEDPNMDDEIFLDRLYTICRNVRKDQGESNLPEWTSRFVLPGEEIERKNLKKIESQILKLHRDKQASEKRLANYLPIKLLWSSSGASLEISVKKVFEELGFQILHSEPDRDDVIMKLGEEIIIVEIKGQTKSAAEKNAAQLEKWVSTYLSNEGIEPKGILLVNTFRETPINERTQVSFPQQMIPYSERRNHCLLTTLQLCTLLLHCRANPNQKSDILGDLIKTVGVYENFNNWSDFISSGDAPD